MKRLILSLLVGVGVLLPFNAVAIDWYLGCQIHAGAIVKALSAGQFACINPVSADPDADSLLETTACDNIDAFWLLDQNGDSTASTGTVQLEACPYNAALDSESEFALACRNYGAVLDTSNESNLGLGGALIWANAASPDEDPQLVVSCNGPNP